MAEKPRKLPPVAYLRWNDMGDGDLYLSASRRKDELISEASVEPGEAVLVGIYELVEVQEVKTVLQTKVVKHGK